MPKKDTISLDVTDELVAALNGSDGELGAHLRTILQKAISDVKLPMEQEFEAMWGLYQRYGVKRKAMQYWRKLSQRQREEILEVVPEYVKHTSVAGSDPRLRFRKQLEGYINPANKEWTNRFWEIAAPQKGPMEPSQEYRSTL